MNGKVSNASLKSNHLLLMTQIFEVLPFRNSKATDGRSTSSSTNLYTSTSYTSKNNTFQQFCQLIIHLVDKYLVGDNKKPLEYEAWNLQSKREEAVDESQHQSRTGVPHLLWCR